MTWMRLEMTADESGGELEGIQEAFFAVWTSAGTPKEARMYASRIGENAFYFSPAAANLFSAVLKNRGAEPCSEPSYDDLSILVQRES